MNRLPGAALDRKTTGSTGALSRHARLDPDLLAAKGNPKAVLEHLLARRMEEAGQLDDFCRAIHYDADHPIPGENRLDAASAAILRKLRRNGARKRDFILRAIGPCRGLSVLDAGCGVCGVTHHLQKAGAHIVGVDMDRQSLTVGRRVLMSLKNDVPILQADVRVFPFADESFDLVLLTDVLEHICEKDRVLAGTHRILRNRGRVLITTDNAIRVQIGVWMRRFLAVMRFENPLAWNVPWGGEEGGHVALTTPSALRALLRRHGFIPRAHNTGHHAAFTSCVLAPSFLILGTKKHIP